MQVIAIYAAIAMLVIASTALAVVHRSDGTRRMLTIRHTRDFRGAQHSYFAVHASAVYGLAHPTDPRLDVLRFPVYVYSHNRFKLVKWWLTNTAPRHERAAAFAIAQHSLALAS